MEPGLRLSVDPVKMDKDLYRDLIVNKKQKAMETFITRPWLRASPPAMATQALPTSSDTEPILQDASEESETQNAFGATLSSHQPHPHQVRQLIESAQAIYRRRAQEEHPVARIEGSWSALLHNEGSEVHLSPTELREGIKTRLVMGARRWRDLVALGMVDFDEIQKQRRLILVRQLLGPPAKEGPAGEAMDTAPDHPEASSEGLIADPYRVDIPMDVDADFSEVMTEIPLAKLRTADTFDECDWCQVTSHSITTGVPTHLEPQPTDEKVGPPPLPSKICVTCTVTRLDIVQHTTHGPWIDARLSAQFALEPDLSQTNRALAMACDVCTGLATASCWACQLMVCVGCRGWLDGFCHGHLDELMEALGPGALKRDAILLSRKSLREVLMWMREAPVEMAESCLEVAGFV